MPSWRVSGWNRLFALWLGAAALTSLTSYGETTTIDALLTLDTARHLAAGGMPIVEGLPGQPGIDGRLYSQYAPANTLALVPAAWAGAAVAGLGYGGTTRTIVEEFASSQIAAGARAGVAVLVFALLSRLRPDRAASNIGLALLSLFVAFDAQYGRAYYSEIMVQLTVLGAVIGLVDLAQGAAPVRRAAAIGACAAAGVAFRYDAAVFIPVFAWVLVTVTPADRRLKAAVAFAVPLAIAGVAIGAFNTIRFGAPWITGYPSGMFVGSPWRGWIGLLVSPGAGLLWFAPIAFGLFLPDAWTGEPGGARRVLRRSLAGLLTAHVLFIGTFFAWSGSAWGPRFLAVLMPLLLVCVFDSWFRAAAARRIGLALAAAGVAMNVLLLVSPYERYQASALASGWTTEERLWRVDRSPLLHQPRLAREVIGNLGDLDRFSTRATARLEARGSTNRFEPDNPADMLRTSVLLNVPALWWVKATLAGVPVWLALLAPAVGLCAAAAAIRVAIAGTRADA